ncbi:MAG: ribosome maturation factor RimP [Aquihabitans sp.]
MDTAQRIRELVAPLIDEAGAMIYDLEYAGGVLRVTLDKEGGVDIGTIGKVTRGISHLLDEVDPIHGEYTLEVTSPGLERALRTVEHFVRAVGDTVAIKTCAGVEGERRFKAVVVAADEAAITLVPEGAAPHETRLLGYDQIERARTIFEWGPAPKPGGPKPKPGSSTSSPSAKKKAAKS